VRAETDGTLGAVTGTPEFENREERAAAPNASLAEHHGCAVFHRNRQGGQQQDRGDSDEGSAATMRSTTRLKQRS